MWIAYQYVMLLIFSLLLGLGFSAVAVKLVDLQVIRHEELAKKAKALLVAQRQIPGWRGSIQTADGSLLALTIPVKDVYCDLTLGTPWMEEMIGLWSGIVNENPREMKRRWLRSWLKSLRDPARRMPGAVLVKREATLEQWAQLTNAMAQQNFKRDPARMTGAQVRLRERLRHRMLSAVDMQKRFYPRTNLAGYVVGHVYDSDSHSGLRGASGIEKAMNSILAGKPGIQVSRKDALGRELPHQRGTTLPPEDGGNVVLTIDMRIQQICEEELRKLAKEHRPKTASILVMQPLTGAILAWACWPDFSLADPGRTNGTRWLNDPLASMREPGSVFKPFTLAAALSERLVDLDFMIHCRFGTLIYKRARVSDHGLAYGLVPVRFGFAKSLNTMHALLGLHLGTQRFFHYVTNFGFGQCTGIQLPGEMPGWIGARAEPENLPEFYAGFGQGISVTSLQLLMAWGAIANDGLLMRPRLIARIEDDEGKILYACQPEPVRRVISPEVAGQVKEALEGVVTKEGTGRAAAMAWHTDAGKTGTAQQADGIQGYVSNRVCAFFYGIVPARKPELVIGVTVDEPEGRSRSGGAIAAPIFRSVAEQSAWLLNIQPDKYDQWSYMP